MTKMAILLVSFVCGRCEMAERAFFRLGDNCNPDTLRAFLAFDAPVQEKA
jgi:hypothetical protein